MAHNIKEHDSMISVGVVPWHKLGTTLAEPPKSGAEAIEKAKMNWTVRKDPMFLEDGRQVKIEGSVSRKNDGCYGTIIRDDTNEQLGVVGPAYHPLQNSRMAALFDPIIEDGTVTIETCGSLFNGRRVWMLAKFTKSEELISGKDDVVSKYLMIAHGHDGSLAVRFGFTPVRIVCWNTMSMAIYGKQDGSKTKRKSSQLVKCLHTTNLEENLELLRDSIVESEKVFAITAEKYRELANRGVSRASLREYARIIVGADEDEKERTHQQAKKIGQIVGAAFEGRGNHGRTWWDAYNGATEYLTWNAGTRADTRFNSLWFGENADLNAKALDLALEMSLAV